MPNSSPLLEVMGTGVSPDHYIGGRRVASAQTFELRSPIDQRVLGQVSEGLAVKVQ
jgi:5-carboxymethyl-2-hydroxymuconic-semialdehyde dehydrogenase